MNKKGIANIYDPVFWGIAAGIWFIVNIVMWKFTYFEGFVSTRIAFTIVSAPVIFGLCYLMGQNG